MEQIIEKAVVDFFTYPSVGTDDWRYGYATARVRVLETFMLPKMTLSEMAGAAMKGIVDAPG
jgi:hypothetical protein